MIIENRKSFLELEVIWKGEDMFELRVTAANGRYFGTTNVYDSTDSLKGFANSLFGYPKSEGVLFYDAGKKDGYAYFSMKFYCIDNAGHIGLQVTLEEKVPTNHRQEQKDKLTLEILVEPNAIDSFQKELLHLAINEEGSAILYGRNN